MIGLLVRLMPIAVVGYAMRDGTESAEEMIDKVSDLANVIVAQAELRGVAKHIELETIHGKSIPTDLPSYMRDYMTAEGGADEDTGLDPWGERYRIERSGKRYRLYSSGPDLRAGTDDDTEVWLKVQ